METATPRRVAVALNPVPGFCVKSRATNDALIHLTASDQPPVNDVHVTKGLKIFVNITWDTNVPPPPPASDDAIGRAMQGLDTDDPNPGTWFVPIVISDARQDSDKGWYYSLSVLIVRSPPWPISISDLWPLLTLSISGPVGHRVRLRPPSVHQISLPQRPRLQELHHRYSLRRTSYFRSHRSVYLLQSLLFNISRRKQRWSSLGRLAHPT